LSEPWVSLDRNLKGKEYEGQRRENRFKEFKSIYPEINRAFSEFHVEISIFLISRGEP